MPLLITVYQEVSGEIGGGDLKSRPLRNLGVSPAKSFIVSSLNMLSQLRLSAPGCRFFIMDPANIFVPVGQFS
jgi:hypothetical protein